jgi:hypothetical protein
MTRNHVGTTALGCHSAQRGLALLPPARRKNLDSLVRRDVTKM